MNSPVSLVAVLDCYQQTRKAQKRDNIKQDTSPAVMLHYKEYKKTLSITISESLILIVINNHLHILPVNIHDRW
jgi:hypothetical protein